MFRKSLEQSANVNIRVKWPKRALQTGANKVVKVNDEIEDSTIRLITIICLHWYKKKISIIYKFESNDEA